MAFTIPALQGEPMPGSTFVAIVRGLAPGAGRDAAFEAELRRGNIPSFLRIPVAVPVDTLRSGERIVHLGKVFVLPDVLAIGTDEDFVRVPMTPILAQKVADLWGAMLITRRLSDVLWHAAPAKLEPIPMGPPYDATMMSVDRFYEHHQRIETQRAAHPHGALGTLIAGHKKDVVVTPQLLAHPHRVAIYGWHTSQGSPIQPLNATSHDDLYADYSHGIRLVDRFMEIDGASAPISHVLSDPNVCALVSDEGPSRVWRQP